jgi:methyltransferase-like protein/ubiquinone/menaquinone biosynthesis C-methylase UbiE
MSPAPPRCCRVLELGCASGGNLIPLAEALPTSHFSGLDLSPTQIAEGQEAIAHLGLRNIDLHCRDLAEIEAAYGEFDYIIAHGLYSWVPEEVRSRLLEVCRRSLAPQGIAYVSYNVFPGWHLLGAIREMLLYHTRDATDPASRASAARDFISFFVEATPADAGPFAAFVHAYQEQVGGRDRVGGSRGEDLLLHDELAEINEPFHFANFVHAAEEHDLQYVADADFPTSTLRFAPNVRERLHKYANNPVEMEQYADFLRARTFRQSLLCRSDVELSRRLRVSDAPLRELYFSSAARLASEPSDQIGEFETADGRRLRTNHPVSRAAMEVLIEKAPETLTFEQLLTAATEVAKGRGIEIDVQRDSQEIATTLLKGFLDNMALVEFRLEAPALTKSCSTRPVASPYARWRASSGDLVVTNRKHQRVEIDEATRRLLALLDGSRTQRDILDELAGTQGADSDFGKELMAKLEWCAASGLLCA